MNLLLDTPWTNHHHRALTNATERGRMNNQSHALVNAPRGHGIRQYWTIEYNNAPRARQQ